MIFLKNLRPPAKKKKITTPKKIMKDKTSIAILSK